MCFILYDPVGRNSSKINVPFLNYVSNIRARIGHGMTIRVGGNSQEHTGLYMTPFPDYEIINKTVESTTADPVGLLIFILMICLP